MDIIATVRVGKSEVKLLTGDEGRGRMILLSLGDVHDLPLCRLDRAGLAEHALIDLSRAVDGLLRIMQQGA